MGNVCTCCKWGRRGVDSNSSTSKKLDKTDTWFEQDSVPLVSARYGLDDIGSDEADGSLKRTVLIRSPRPTSTSTSVIDERSSHTSRHHLQQHEQEEHYHARRVKVKSASVDSSSNSRHRSRRTDRGDDEKRPRSRHRHSLQGNDSDNRPHHSMRTARTSSLEVQDSTREMRSPSSPTSPRVTTYSQDTALFADDEVESVDSFHNTTRSHRSSSTSSSPKASSRSGSPQKKERYGRKHYRANANRK
ncbi:Hypothetical protein PHPALM_13251 [Phytophthora palmivora]|uniref:Uncharacterized protein n=1 Tax=Phytophthora palmivora TaxID=4796 RepID=A0A2P4XXP8_9STRA|nr:Hypothetical protein PHPALM_13251 [Phytophthora palmivora]